MTHQPGMIAEGAPAYAVAIAEFGRARRLVIYAGAGLSRAEPAGLPSGSQVARSLYDRLRDAFPTIEGTNPDSLSAVADAVAALPSGVEALRLTAVKVAEFTAAQPTYGHRILALLLLEGVLAVLTTNWDDCVERAGGSEHVPSMVTEDDLLQVAPSSVLKIHGCATRPASLLITSAHLAAPPTWVKDQARAKLGTSVVVFVGIGDIADYIRTRLEEAIDDVGDVNNIRVVGPTINEGWEGSPWQELIPSLDLDHRIQESADTFLEKVGVAYVLSTLAEMSAGLQDEPALAASFAQAFAALKNHDALTVLEWARRSGVIARAGISVLASESMAQALAAIGRLGGQGIKITRDGILATPNGSFEILVAVGLQTPSRLRREARNRLERHVGNGLGNPKFVIAGGVGWPADNSAGLRDIIEEGDPKDVLDGPLNLTPEILRAEAVVAP